ncbi:Alg9-like mannosyltransferase family-domain-containing protein [Xylogone sp. PMI_703]|nr:Alg9-like mannosyltransferase family-domain-containing protein [Xylogone sp. PMI_703]
MSSPADSKTLDNKEGDDGKSKAVAPPLPTDKYYPQVVVDYMNKDVITLLMFLRLINALFVHTFFQPDEYFQALEPAWQIAFGKESGAWITWEWQNQLRSSLHPALFAAFYFVGNRVMTFLSMYPQFRAIILSVLPHVIQSVIATVGDFCTWKLAQKMYGRDSNATWAALILCCLSPWEWFCSTRTFSNSLETTLTIAGLCFWPWGLCGVTTTAAKDGKSSGKGIFQTTKDVNYLRISLLAASTACILRPTNLLIWFCVFMPVITKLVLGVASPVQSVSSGPNPTLTDYLVLVRELILCGGAVLGISMLSDRAYYGEWTFPAYKFLYFNLAQDLAVFYGRNPWHYYLSQGLPLLLTTYLPFTLIAFFKTPTDPSLPQIAQDLSFLLSTVVATVVFALSLISHKEVRFIYPLLPILHIITAPLISSYFATTTTTTTTPPRVPGSKLPPPKPKTTTTTTFRHKPILFLMLILNISIAAYTTQIHQRGVLSVLKFLRSEYESLALDARGNLISLRMTYPGDNVPHKITDYTDGETFVGFLMPCHSTPWRSQLYHPGLNAWALTCEPPLTIPPHTPERENYRDEADRFYDDPKKFLSEEIGGKERPWPRYIVGFEGIEQPLRQWYESEFPGFKMRERWSVFNSHFHDDERRRGRVVVWEFVDGSKTKA